MGLDELKKELSQLRVAKSSSIITYWSNLFFLQPSGSQVNCPHPNCYEPETKGEFEKTYKNRKYKPLDLRSKRTRAMRRALTPHEKGLKTSKQLRDNRAFPMRKFAVKA